MFKRLEEIIKKLQGNVLVIGLDSKLLDAFNLNHKVNLYSIYSSDTSKLSNIFSKSKKKRTNQGKLVNIKRLRKYINKKSVDYLIINIDEVMDYYKYLIKDSIYLNNNTIYIYSSDTTNKEFICNKYKRYNVELKITDYKNGYIIKIDNKNGKNNLAKDFIYLIKDTLHNIADFIGNILVS